MDARRIVLSFAALTMVAGVACSSATESTGSGSEAIAKGPSPYPAPPPLPVWPPADATYCAPDPSCAVFSPPSRLWVNVDPALLASLGCTQEYGLTGTSDYPLGVAFAVCLDTPEVAAQLTPLEITCDHCLPALPPGEIYVNAGGPFVKPNCPSGCPAGGPSGPGGGLGRGTSGVSASE
jgi:hypothetical protein